MTTELTPTVIYEVDEGMEGIVHNKTTLTAVELQAALHQIADAAKTITAEDLTDDVQLSKVNETRKRLAKIRVSVKKQSKAQRDQYTVLARANSEVEKMLIGIIEPEEDRLASLESDARLLKERAARAALLPMRKEMVGQFSFVTMTDDQLLDLDMDQFNAKLNEWTAEKLRLDREALEVEKAQLAKEAEMKAAAARAVEEERARVEAQAKADEAARVAKEVARQAEIAAAEEAQRAEAARAAQKMIEDAKAEAARIEAEAKQKAFDEHMRREREEIDKKHAEQERQAQESYKKWLEFIGYKEEEVKLWVLQNGTDGKVYAYKFVDSYPQS